MADRVNEWLDRYFAAWASNDPVAVGALFARDATYAVSPFAEPWRGRDEIVRRWTAGNGELRHHEHTVLAAGAGSGVAHWRVVVATGAGGKLEMDGMLLLAFNDDGECTDHREWYMSRTLDEPTPAPQPEMA